MTDLAVLFQDFFIYSKLMSRIIAITDIHGCFKTFKKLINKKVAFQQEDQLYLLGDYIDRGPLSMQVIDWIIKKQKKGFNIQCLMGNHEQMMLKSLENKSDRRSWLSFGGIQTLQSFGVENIEDVPLKYWDFLKKLRYYIETEEHLFVHAGLNLRIRFPLRDTESLLWIRQWNKNPKYKGKQIVLHGHTPIVKQEIEENFKNLAKEKVMNLDAGCCYIGELEEGKGRLCAIDLTNNKLYFQKNIDKMGYAGL